VTNGVKLVRVAQSADLEPALCSVGLSIEQPVVVLVGGTTGMTLSQRLAVSDVVLEVMIPTIERVGAAVIDGGTDSGVMQVVGRARSRVTAGFPLVGVAAAGTVILDKRSPPRAGAAMLEPHHTHFVIVPGGNWGDEAPWISQVATAVAGARSSLTVLIGGGEIAYADVVASLQLARPVLILAGTGRTADVIAAARVGEPSDVRAAQIAASPIVSMAHVGDLPGVRAQLDQFLGVEGSR